MTNMVITTVTRDVVMITMTGGWTVLCVVLLVFLGAILGSLK